MTRLRAGVVGVGYLGAFHAEKYAAADGVELAAVVDADAARAREVGERLGVPWFTEHAALAGLVDCASVATPTAAHHAIARDLLAGGIDVLVEKPLTSTVAQGRDLLEVAARGGRVLQVGHLERFNPAMRAVADYIGAPRFIESQRLATFGPRGTDIDVILDLMIHDLDLVLSMVGSPVRSVDAVGVPVLTAAIDIADVRLRFANGCVANVTASRVSPKRERKLRIFQPDAYFSIDFDQRQVRMARRHRTPTGGARVTLDELVVDEGDALRAEIEAFVAAVRARDTPPVSGWDGLRALEIAEVIRQTVETEVRAAGVAPT
ncbi:MAG TPA: Gfo/Idh/MocA family oxidoreductase [Candidatus Limnocylindria bacterium]|nr:Gfo/Idh/MocA family oxidoreductase [Candidatus Limnocylindria bacterium]